MYKTLVFGGYGALLIKYFPDRHVGMFLVYIHIFSVWREHLASVYGYGALLIKYFPDQHVGMFHIFSVWREHLASVYVNIHQNIDNKIQMISTLI